MQRVRFRSVLATAAAAAALAAAAVIAVPPPAAAEVLAPIEPGTYTFHVEFGSSAIGDFIAEFPEGLLPECSDGIDNDLYLDEEGEPLSPPADFLIDHPDDPECAGPDDASEVVPGHQPFITTSFTGTIDEHGAINIPIGGVVFPPAFIYADGLGGSGNLTNILTIRTVASQAATGSIDPATGHIDLQLRLRVKMEGGSGLTALGASCFIGGTGANGILAPGGLTTSTTTAPASPPEGWEPLTGSPYDSETNRATLVANSYAVPTATGCGLFGAGNGIVNDMLGLPLSAGVSAMSFTVSMDPAPASANVASLVASPESGAAPFTTTLDASGSTSLAGIDRYDFDCDGDGEVDVSTGSPTAQCTYSALGAHTPSVRIVDVDGHGASASTSVTVVENTAPVADDIVVTTHQGAPVETTLTGSDADGHDLAFAVASDPGNGTLTGVAPQLTYTPDGGFTGEDTFTFTVDDGHGGTATGTVTVHVGNAPPVADSATVSTRAGDPVDITLTGSGPDGDDLTFEVVDGPDHGTLTGDAPDLTYTPDAGFAGQDSFTFAVSDGAASAQGTVTIEVENEAPVADDQLVATAAGAPVDITLTGSDPDGDDLTFEVVDGPDHGTLTGDAPTLTYAPDPGFSGQDAFTFAVHDGHGGTDVATVTITVDPALVALTAHPAIAISRLLSSVTQIGAVSATLTEAGGAPVVGAPVTFRALGQTICTGTTNANGLATCSGQVNGLLLLILAFGYDVQFAGTDTHLPSSAHGQLLSL